MSKLNATVEDAAQQANAQADALASETLKPLVDHLLSGVHQAVEHLASVATQAADKVQLSGEYLKATQVKAVRGARGYVREQPLTAVGIALASGFLLSWALRQR